MRGTIFSSGLIVTLKSIWDFMRRHAGLCHETIEQQRSNLKYTYDEPVCVSGSHKTAVVPWCIIWINIACIYYMLARERTVMSWEKYLCGNSFVPLVCDMKMISQNTFISSSHLLLNFALNMWAFKFQTLLYMQDAFLSEQHYYILAWHD